MTFSKNGTWLTFNKEFTLFYQFTSLDLGLGITDFLGLYCLWLSQGIEQPNQQITDYPVTIKGSCSFKNIYFL